MVVSYRTRPNFHVFPPMQLLSAPQHIVTYINHGIPQYVCRDLREPGAMIVGNSIFHDDRYPTGFSLLWFFVPGMLNICSLHNYLIEKIGTYYRRVHISIFGSTSSRNPCTIYFYIFEFNIFHDHKLLKHVTKMSLCQRRFAREWTQYPLVFDLGCPPI